MRAVVDAYGIVFGATDVEVIGPEKYAFPETESAVEEAYEIVRAELVGALKVTLPFEYASPLENVVVAVHVGLPFTIARTVPPVEDATRASDVGVFA